MPKLIIERVDNGYVVDDGKGKKISENLDDIFDKMKISFKNGFSNQRLVYEFTYDIKQPENKQ